MNKNGGAYEVLSCKTKTSIRRFKKRLCDEIREGGLWKSALFLFENGIKDSENPERNGKGQNQV